MYRTAIILILASSLVACGDGIVAGLFGSTETVHIASAPDDSGYAWSTAGTVVKSTAAQFLVGDGFFLNATSHAFVRFNLALVPAGANVTEARLIMGQESLSNDPYGELGPSMLIDQVDMGPTFDIADMTAPVVIQPLGVFSQTATLGAKEADVEAAVDHAVANGWSRVDFRLRFEQATNSDGLGDWARLNNEADDGGSGIRPTLVVTYLD